MKQDQITVSRQQMEQAAATFALLLAARESPAAYRETAPALSEALSFSNRRAGRTFMRPEAARAFARLRGQDAARQFLGGHAYRDAASLFSQPTTTDVHVDAILTDISVRYRNTMHIAPALVPRVQVVHRSNKYFVFDLANARNEAKERAPGAAAARGGYSLSTGSYAVINYAHETQVPDEVRSNSDNPLNPDRNGAQYVADIIDLKYEKQAASLIQTSANWTTNATLAGTSQWSDFANSDPFTDFKTARLTVLQQILRLPNTVQMGIQTFEALALHPDFLDRCKYTGTGERPAMVTAEMMAQLLRVDQVLVGASVENTAVEGQTDSLSYVWGKHAWVGFVADAPAIDTPSAAYCFTIGRMMDRYREESTRSDILRGEEDWDMRKVAAGAGYRIITAVA